jgi:hypothetical protein
MHFSTLIITAAALAGFGAAHPGHNVAQEMQEREAAMQGLPRNLAHCAEKMKARGITAAAAARRAKVAKEARQARGLNTGTRSPGY